MLDHVKAQLNSITVTAEGIISWLNPIHLVEILDLRDGIRPSGICGVVSQVIFGCENIVVSRRDGRVEREIVHHGSALFDPIREHPQHHEIKRPHELVTDLLNLRAMRLDAVQRTGHGVVGGREMRGNSQPRRLDLVDLAEQISESSLGRVRTVLDFSQGFQGALPLFIGTRFCEALALERPDFRRDRHFVDEHVHALGITIDIPVNGVKDRIPLGLRIARVNHRQRFLRARRRPLQLVAPGASPAMNHRVVEYPGAGAGVVLPIYYAKVVYLLPRWHGEPGDIERFAEKVADQRGGDDGDMLYMFLARRLAEADGKEKFFDYSEFSWPRMKRGFEARIKNPRNLNLEVNHYCYFACLKKERETAKRLFKEIGTQWRSEAWGNQGVFEQWRKWAGS
jgi:hypothetical protein